MTKLMLKIFILLCLLNLQVNAQLSTREVPVGFKYNFGEIPIFTMPHIDVEGLLIEDEEDNFRFGYIHKVNIESENKLQKKCYIRN